MVAPEIIRAYVDEIVRRFDPEQVILFGSYATGQATEDSDVDLAVVMATDDEIEQATAIRCAISRDFALDLIVYHPDHLRRRLQIGDFFLRDIVERGRVLHDKRHTAVGAEG